MRREITGPCSSNVVKEQQAAYTSQCREKRILIEGLFVR